MLFKFKKNYVSVDIFTSHHRAFKDYKITEAIKFFPSWLKKTDSFYHTEKSIAPMPTLKSCSGLLDNYKKGFILPLWSDLILEQKFSDKEYVVNYQFADKQSNADCHPPKQWENFLSPNNFFHLKINTPWVIKTKKQFQWYLCSPYWNLNPFKMSVASGVVDFYNQHDCNVNMFIPHLKEKFLIKQDTPLLYLLPLTDKNIKVKHHLISGSEMAKFTRIRSSFLNDFYIGKKKCPFSDKNL